MLRQDSELAHDHGQLAVVLHVEIEGDLVRPGRLGARDVLVIEAHARIGVFVHPERIDHVVGRDRRAVVPARFVAELEGDRGIVWRKARPLGDQPVRGRWLIETVSHQALEHEPEPSRRLALVENRVEAVERADVGHAHDAAFRRVRIHVAERFEVGGIFRLADQRQRVMVDRRVLGVARCGQEAGEEEGNEKAGRAHADALKLLNVGGFGGRNSSEPAS